MTKISEKKESMYFMVEMKSNKQYGRGYRDGYEGKLNKFSLKDGNYRLGLTQGQSDKENNLPQLHK